MKIGLLAASCLVSLCAAWGAAQSAGPESVKSGGAAAWNGVGAIVEMAAEQGAAREKAAAARNDSKVGFKPRSSATELKNGEGQVWARVETGEANGLPAARVRTSFDHKEIVVARAAKAKSWDSARAACRKLAPAGAWDLPLEEDYMTLTFTKAVSIKVGGDTDAIYPMWLRFADESKNSDAFAGKSTLLAMADGKGADMQALDVGPETIAEAREALKEIEFNIKQKRYRSSAEEKRVREAIAEYNRRNGTQTWFNPDVTHRELPADVNVILLKPSLKRLTEGQAKIKTGLDAFENGYPAYCVSR